MWPPLCFLKPVEFCFFLYRLRLGYIDTREEGAQKIIWFDYVYNFISLKFSFLLSILAVGFVFWLVGFVCLFGLFCLFG